MELLYKGILIGIAIGVLSVTLVIPIIQQIESVIVNALEVLNGYSTVAVTKKNSQIQQINADTQDKLEPVATQAIGFEVPTLSIEEEDEDL